MTGFRRHPCERFHWRPLVPREAGRPACVFPYSPSRVGKPHMPSGRPGEGPRPGPRGRDSGGCAGHTRGLHVRPVEPVLSSWCCSDPLPRPNAPGLTGPYCAPRSASVVVPGSSATRVVTESVNHEKGRSHPPCEPLSRRAFWVNHYRWWEEMPQGSPKGTHSGLLGTPVPSWKPHLAVFKFSAN